jgi:DNA-binding IclR family transcriptional regulator
MVVQLAGTAGYVVANTEGLDRFVEPPAVIDPLPLWAFAGGHCILSQLDDDAVERLVGPGPYPTFTAATIATADALRDRLADVRAGHAVVEIEEYGAGVACVALPWISDSATVPTAISVVGPRAIVEPRAAEIEAVLRRALLPGANLTVLSALTNP